jgi:ribosomal protein S18 acetylase RimI-like enzyme
MPMDGGDQSPALLSLGGANWPHWRAARLAALADSPESFPNAATEWADGGEELWQGRLLDPAALKVVAVGSDRVPVGLVRAEVDGDAAWLHSLWVSPEHRGRGLGVRLLSAVETWARPRAPILRLEVVPTNEPAIALYRRHGFVDTILVGERLPGGGRELVMEKAMRPAAQPA